MELKIRIKEVKEEARKLTIEEWAMYLLSINGRSIYQHDAQDIVKSWGLIKFENGLIGFRTETIRDATPEEIMAYHCIKIHDECGLKVKECDTCVMNIWEHGTCGMGKLFLNSTKILNGKEVILELV